MLLPLHDHDMEALEFKSTFSNSGSSRPEHANNRRARYKVPHTMVQNEPCHQETEMRGILKSVLRNRDAWLLRLLVQLVRSMILVIMMSWHRPGPVISFEALVSQATTSSCLKPLTMRVTVTKLQACPWLGKKSSTDDSESLARSVKDFLDSDSDSPRLAPLCHCVLSAQAVPAIL